MGSLAFVYWLTNGHIYRDFFFMRLRKTTTEKVIHQFFTFALGFGG